MRARRDWGRQFKRGCHLLKRRSFIEERPVLRRHLGEGGGASDREVMLSASVDDGRARNGAELALLGGVLDNMEQAVILLRSDAYPCYSNLAARRLFINEGDGLLLTREMHSVSEAARKDGEKPAEAEVSTRAGRYRLRATLLLDKIKEISNRAVLVTIDRTSSTAPAPSRAELMRRFGMTAREADVALLLASGNGNSAVASELRISPHTARHHTENVMTKLGVHTRAAVAEAIRADRANGHRNGK